MAREVVTLDRETYRILLWGTYMGLLRHLDETGNLTAKDVLDSLHQVGKDTEEDLLHGICRMCALSVDEMSLRIMEGEDDG